MGWRGSTARATRGLAVDCHRFVVRSFFLTAVSSAEGVMQESPAFREKQHSWPLWLQEEVSKCDLLKAVKFGAHF